MPLYCTSNFLKMYLNQADDVLKISYYLVCFFNVVSYSFYRCFCNYSVLALLPWTRSFPDTECLPRQISSIPPWPCSPSISCCFFSFAPFSKWSNHKWNEACRIKISKFAAAHWLNNGRCMGVWNAASAFHQLVFFSTQPIPPRVLGNLLVERKFCFFLFGEFNGNTKRVFKSRVHDKSSCGSRGDTPNFHICFTVRQTIACLVLSLEIFF